MDKLDVKHVIVFDCNIYLRLAASIESPISIETIRTKVLNKDSSLQAGTLEAAQAVIYSLLGKLGTDEQLVVCASKHIVDTVIYKATDRAPGGLQLTNEDADALVEDVIQQLVTSTGGICAGPLTHVSTDNPPLDHEDGMVFGLCRHLGSEYNLATVWLITLDKYLLQDVRKISEINHIKVVPPQTFISYFRARSNKMKGLYPSRDLSLKKI